MGLDRNGFKRKNYAELYDDMEIKARELFGDDINTSERSPLGIFIRLFSYGLSKAWELAEKVYNSGIVTKAEGVQLDNLTPFFNTKRNAEQAALVVLSFTGTPGHTVTAGKQFTTENDIYFELTEDVTLDGSGNGGGEAVSLDVGVVGNVPADTITVQAEPDADLLTVTNPEAASSGRDYETDQELLNRLLDSSAANGYGTANAIRAAVINVPGVRAATVIVNNENTVVDGNNPKSVHVYALGGDGAEVAEAIFTKVAAGIETMGAQLHSVVDDSGQAQVIKFDFAAEVPIYVEVDVTTDLSYPVDGNEQIQDEIVKVIGGTANDGTVYIGSQMGDDVIVSQLTRKVFEVAGVTDATVRIGKSAGTLGTTNIEILANEVAQTDPAKVAVV